MDTRQHTHTQPRFMCKTPLRIYGHRQQEAKAKKKKPKDFHSKIMNIFLLQFNFLNKCVSKHTMTLRTLRFFQTWLSGSVWYVCDVIKKAHYLLL